MPYVIPDRDTSSEMFKEACRTAGAPVIECDCCITHYALGRYEYEDMEPIPDECGTVKHHDVDYIIEHTVDNKQLVADCPGCEKKLRRYENFIWNHRETIRQYLKTRCDQEKKWADHEALANLLAGIE